MRPSFEPFPDAPIDTIQADAEVVVREAAGRITERGFRLKANAPLEGYLETRWLDLVSGKSGAHGAAPNRIVRIRIFADPVTPRSTQLTVETVYRRTLDPSLPERETELTVPPGSPGDSLARNIIAEVKRKLNPS